MLSRESWAKRQGETVGDKAWGKAEIMISIDILLTMKYKYCLPMP